MKNEALRSKRRICRILTQQCFKISFEETMAQKKKNSQKSGKQASKKEKLPDGIEFRERKFGEVIKGLKHPKPIPGYKATLPGPPGWQAKERPGA